MAETKTSAGTSHAPEEEQGSTKTIDLDVSPERPASSSDIKLVASSQSFDWFPETPPMDPALREASRASTKIKTTSMFSITSMAPIDEEEYYQGSDCYSRALNALHRLRHRYESEGGGKMRLRLHFLTNTFYLAPKVEKSFQLWCVNTQLRSNRNLLMVIAAGFFFYQMFSATKKKHGDLQTIFSIRLAASVLFAVIIILLFTCKGLARQWKLMLSVGICTVLGIEVFYRAEKLYIEGGLIKADAMTLLGNTTAAGGGAFDTSDLFKRVGDIGAFSSNAKAVSTALTLLEDELLITANRYWPMWSVIISVILHIDVIFILPIMLSVLTCYITATALYIRNPFEEGILGDSQTMVLLVAMLILLLWLGHYNDRFLRHTYVQIKDSGAENEKLRKRLKLLGEQKKQNEHPGTNITTPMEGVLLSLNSIKDEILRGPQANQLGESLEKIIDTLSKPEAMKGIRLEDQLNAENADADVTSWLIDQAGLGGGSYREDKGQKIGTPVRSSMNDWSFARTTSARRLVVTENLDVLMTQSAKTLMGDLDDCWDLDTLKLHEVTGGRPLFALFWTVMQKHQLLGLMKCSPQTFSNFITKIEDGYLDNPYHNSTHGADVLNGCHHFVQHLGFKEIITTWQTYSLFISAAIHDFEHPGVSNTFLVNTKSPLAILYNDIAVCESMHVARAFEVMQESGGCCNILEGISETMYRKVRRCIIDTVMVTDLSKHLDFTARLRTILATGKGEEAFADQGLLLQIAIKSSDIGHCSKARPLHLKWTELIVEEMFRQGDKERERGDQISSFCDRTSANTPKNQIGFFEFVILPWWRALWQLDGRFGRLTHATEGNHQYWIEVRDTSNDPLGSGRSLNREKTRSKSVMTLTLNDPVNSPGSSTRRIGSGSTGKNTNVDVTTKKGPGGNMTVRRNSDSRLSRSLSIGSSTKSLDV